jgi:hypothetical protein
MLEELHKFALTDGFAKRFLDFDVIKVSTLICICFLEPLNELLEVITSEFIFTHSLGKALLKLVFCDRISILSLKDWGKCVSENCVSVFLDLFFV